MLKIIVLGYTGMLGSYVYSYFKQAGYEVIGKGHDCINALEITYPELDYWLSTVCDPGDIVINCIGLIKQKNYTVKDQIIVNALFPHLLADVCEVNNVNFIHISTDCVFSGMKGHYSEDDLHDCTDTYGKTKSLGEPQNATVIRTSIIGEEKNTAYSLLSWVLSQKEIKGYVNHLWNGMTCLQLAKEIEQIIKHELYWLGVCHFFTIPEITKYDLCQVIADVYKLDIKIEKHDTDICDRTLITIYDGWQVVNKNYTEQIYEQKEFTEKWMK